MYLPRKLTHYMWQPAIVGRARVRRIAAQNHLLHTKAFSRSKKRPNIVRAPHVMRNQYYVSHTTVEYSGFTPLLIP